MASSNTYSIPSSASIGTDIGKELVNELRNGQIPLDVSPNTYPRFHGENEAFDHNGFLDFLGSDLGGEVLREMAQTDEQYLFV